MFRRTWFIFPCQYSAAQISSGIIYTQNGRILLPALPQYKIRCYILFWLIIPQTYFDATDWRTQVNVSYLWQKRWEIKVRWPIETEKKLPHLADLFKCIFVNENVWISSEMSLKVIPKSPINSIPSLVQIMLWCWLGDKPLSEPMRVRLPTQVCVTQPQWVMALRLSGGLEPQSNIRVLIL